MSMTLESRNYVDLSVTFVNMHKNALELAIIFSLTKEKKGDIIKKLSGTGVEEKSEVSKEDLNAGKDV